MTDFIKSGALWVPKEKPKQVPNKTVYAKQWDCPHCGYYYDKDVEPSREEYTVGSICLDDKPMIPHIVCPECGECMACSKSE